MPRTSGPAEGRRSLCSVHPSYAMEEGYRKKLVERTGKTLEEWVAFMKKAGPCGEKERREWLQSQHGLSTNYAWWIAERAEGKGGVEGYDPEALVEAMFAGPKAALRPAYERLLRHALGLGSDVKACPCKTMVPLYRKHVFAELKPATRTRLDLGLALGETKPKGKLESTGRGPATNDRISHRIPIETVADVDDEVLCWLREAYDRADPERGKAERARPVREAKLPADLQAAITGSAKARATFDRLTPRMRADWIGWVESAKQLETRRRRIAIAVEKLAAGRKSMY